MANTHRRSAHRRPPIRQKDLCGLIPNPVRLRVVS